MQHCIPSRVTYLCDKFETKIFQLIRKTIQRFAGLSQVKLHRSRRNCQDQNIMIFLVNTCPSKDSSSRFSMNHTPQLPIHAHVHFVIIFKFLISHQLLFLPSYKTWKDQISDIDAGCVNKTYHDLSITGICDKWMFRFGQNADKGMSYDKEY